MKGVLDLRTRLVREAPATKADGIESDQACPIPGDHCEGRRIEGQLRSARHHDRLAHTSVLMEPRVGAQHREVFDFRVAPEPAEARHDHAIADLAIVTDMGAVHQEGVFADPRTAAPTRGAHVDRDVLADLSARADLETRRRTVESAVLGLTAQAGMGEDPTVGANPRAADQGHVLRDLDPRPKLDFPPDEGERPDHDVRGQDGSVLHMRRRVDVGQATSPFRCRS